jgi:hypothetical protein
MGDNAARRRHQSSVAGECTASSSSAMMRQAWTLLELTSSACRTLNHALR